MKKFLVFLFAMVIGVASATTINLSWVVEGDTYAQTTCESGADLILPTNPTKRGYHFVGWTPTSYTRLDYIESTGTQYIDTGLLPKYDAKYIAKAAFPSLDNTEQTLMGSLISGSGVFFGANDQNKSFIRVGSMSEIAEGNVLLENTLYTFDISLAYGNSVMRVLDDSGALVNQLSISSGALSRLKNLFLFTTNYNNSTIRDSKARMYFAQIYEDGYMVRNFIPVRRNTDNVVGMYDTVTDTFFINAGTGEFVAGPASQNQNME